MVVTVSHFSNPASCHVLNYSISFISLNLEQTLPSFGFHNIDIFEEDRSIVFRMSQNLDLIFSYY